MIKKSEFQKLKDEIEHLRFLITMLQQEVNSMKKNKRIKQRNKNVV